MSEIESLNKSADELLMHFSRRVEKMKNRDEYSVLMRRLNQKEAIETAISYFGEGEHIAVGVDGSMEQAETLEMLLFYVNAIAYSCPFRVAKDSISFEVSSMKKEDKIGASSAVPLWVEDLTYVSEERSSSASAQMQSSLDDVSFSLMLLVELTSAIRSAEIDNVKLIFLDRQVSGTFQSLTRDVRYLLKKEKSALEKIHSGELMRDVFLFNAVPIPELDVPKHGPYLPYHILQKMIVEGFNLTGACKESGLSKEETQKVSKFLLDKDRKYRFMQSSDNLSSESAGYLRRLETTANEVVDRLFESDKHPLKLGEEWLTTIDLNLVNLVKLASLIRKSLRERRMLIGIAKDTFSTDVSRSVIPAMKIDESIRPRLKHDRVMFTILSATNETLFTPPWRSIGYDAVFATLSEDDSMTGLKAARKVASREKMFIKAFFQTRASSKTIFRSPVFLYDRPFMKEYDEPFCNPRKYMERDKVESIEPYLEEKQENQADNMVLLLLASSDHPEVYEAYGHNILLYMADKAAKVDARLKKGMLLGTISLKLTPMARKEKLFNVIRRYRETRAEIEALRSEEDRFATRYE
ncbi:MAG: hypothetical protein QXX17_06190 [Conexivisphaerales archaeon]